MASSECRKTKWTRFVSFPSSCGFSVYGLTKKCRPIFSTNGDGGLKLFSNNTRYQFSRAYNYFFEIRLVLCFVCSMRMGRSLWLVRIYSTFPENSGWRRNYEVLFWNSIHDFTTFSMHLCIGVSSPCGFKNAIFSGWKKGLMLTLQTLQFAVGPTVVTMSSCPISTRFLFFFSQAAVGYEYEGKTEAHASQKGDSWNCSRTILVPYTNCII